MDDELSLLTHLSELTNFMTFTASKTMLVHMWETQLVREYDHINWAYKLGLTRPQIKIVDVSGFYGQWDPLLRQIKISINLIKDHSWPIVLEILKHELAHQLVTDRLNLEEGHGPNFKNFCDLLGVDERFQKAQTQIDLTTICFQSCHQHEETETNSEAQRLLQRVEKLLALAQSSNEHEALIAMERVSELYEKYNIERLRSNNVSADYTHILIPLESQKTKAVYSLICSILMEHFYVKVILADIYIASKNSSEKVIEICGALENLKIAEYVFHFLVRKIEDLWALQQRNQNLPGKFKRSYQLGLLHGFTEKLHESKINRLNNPLETSTSKAVKIISTDKALAKYLSRRHPRLRRIATSSGRVYGSAFSSGQKEGKSIVINRGIEKSSSIIKLLS